MNRTPSAGDAGVRHRVGRGLRRGRRAERVRGDRQLRQDPGLGQRLRGPLHRTQQHGQHDHRLAASTTWPPARPSAAPGTRPGTVPVTTTLRQPVLERHPRRRRQRRLRLPRRRHRHPDQLHRQRRLVHRWWWWRHPGAHRAGQPASHLGQREQRLARLERVHRQHRRDRLRHLPGRGPCHHGHRHQRHRRRADRRDRVHLHGPGAGRGRKRIGGQHFQSPRPPPPAAAGAPRSAINGQLRVCGVKLCNQYNQPIQLRGMCTHGIQWYPQCVNDASLDALATDWKADVLRISMYIQEGGYETNPRLFTDRVHELHRAGHRARHVRHRRLAHAHPGRPELQPGPGPDLLHRDRPAAQGQDQHHLRGRQRAQRRRAGRRSRATPSRSSR